SVPRRSSSRAANFVGCESKLGISRPLALYAANNTRASRMALFFTTALTEILRSLPRPRSRARRIERSPVEEIAVREVRRARGQRDDRIVGIARRFEPLAVHQPGRELRDEG